jgi:hypothetical protein
MVALVIMFPAMVMHYKSRTPVVDPNSIEIRIPSMGGSGGGFNIPPPPFQLSPPGAPATPPSGAASPAPAPATSPGVPPKPN